jgi:hypothetical protein
MYSSSSDIVNLTGTDLDTATVEALIAEADREIDAILDREGLSVPSPTPDLVKLASQYLASALVLRRSRADGSHPDSARIGDYGEQTRIGDVIAEFESRGREALREYIRRYKSADIFRIVGGEGEVTGG